MDEIINKIRNLKSNLLSIKNSSIDVISKDQLEVIDYVVNYIDTEILESVNK